MKLFSRLVLILLPLSALFTSCNEEIDFTSNAIETPVVYCLLDQADTLHYIKVTRAFGGDNDATQVSQIPDSSYYQNIEITVSEISNGTVSRTWNTEDAANFIHDTILTNKEPGAFYYPEQKVYYFRTSPTSPLIAGRTYKLDININDGEYHVTAETALVSGVSITSPSTLGSYSFVTTVNGELAYSNASVKASVGSAKIMDARLEVFFDEYYNGVPVEKSFVWKLGELNGNDITSSSVTFKANGNTFYTLIKNNATNDQTIDKRELSRIRLTVTGGSDELSKYILVNQPSSSLAQNKPTYTNLTVSDGRQAVGIFSARSKVVQEKLEWVNQPGYNRAIDYKSIKELCTGQITGALLFCSDHPVDIANGESFVCQ